MNVGYVYVLQNKSYGSNLLKIGYTARTPDLRSKEIFTGSTGVPDSFDVKYAIKVCDCVKAEAEVHKLLNSYRNKSTREFFVISLELATEIINDVCTSLNEEQGVMYNCAEINYVPQKEEDDLSRNNIVEIPGCNIISSEYQSVLTPEQSKRIILFSKILHEAHPYPLEKYIDGFKRDRNPEREILIWENIAKAYLKSTQSTLVSLEQKKAIFELLLLRSNKSKRSIMANISESILTRKQVKTILKCYNIKPAPIVVSRVN